MLSSRRPLVSKNFVRKFSERLDLSFSKTNYVKNVEIDGIEEKIKYSRIKNKEAEPGRVIVSRKLDKDNSYFQIRINQVSGMPKICVGVCTEDIQINQDISRSSEIWCMNLSSGDKFSNKKWKQYYEMDKEEIQQWKENDDEDEGADHHMYEDEEPEESDFDEDEDEEMFHHRHMHGRLPGERSHHDIIAPAMQQPGLHQGRRMMEVMRDIGRQEHARPEMNPFSDNWTREEA